MPEQQNSQKAADDDGKGRQVGALANRALHMVASQERSVSARQHEENIDRLLNTALKESRDACLKAVERMVALGIARETVADVYIPTIARRMGDSWCLDELSFAEVTIGVSRLQSLLRDLGPEWRADSAANPDSGAALIVVALDEYHTLGAMILAGRLRRTGMSVRLQMGLTTEALRREMETPRYDAVMISASRGENLESLRLLVKSVKTSPSGHVPVIIGGSVLETDQDLKALTGADLVTSDPVEAIKHCGLKTSFQTDAPLEPGT